MADMGLVVVGAAGRMGRMLVRTIHQTPGARLAGAVEAPGSSVLGQDAGTLAGIGPLGIPITDDALDLFSKADGVVDFTRDDELHTCFWWGSSHCVSYGFRASTP